ncbi:hypothetical protein JL2886_02113 [Phaeobacter gallaeciensis]|uniref:Uncharacterized protein n=1 Tax=Phaeobacter gallaeciensis TaxID=60890 RepID=A0A1B0ZS77_9RHOB|nr:hypothetical protein JL2886_02113 [Phaeobacter gallaeciensis]
MAILRRVGLKIDCLGHVALLSSVVSNLPQLCRLAKEKMHNNAFFRHNNAEYCGVIAEYPL